MVVEIQIAISTLRGKYRELMRFGQKIDGVEYWSSCRGRMLLTRGWVGRMERANGWIRIGSEFSANGTSPMFWCSQRLTEQVARTGHKVVDINLVFWTHLFSFRRNLCNFPRIWSEYLCMFDKRLNPFIFIISINLNQQ